MVTRDGGEEALSARAMHSTENGHPGDSPKLCCGPPTLGFELVNTGGLKQQRTQSGITRVAGGLTRGANNSAVNGVRTQHLSNTATASPPPQLAPGLIETGSLGESGTRQGGGNTPAPNVAPVVGAGGGGEGRECAGCGKLITERFLLKALDLFWHEDCLKCGCCDCRLGEVGSTLYTKANLILCKRDYLRLFGNTGCCAACSKVIPAFEMVMRAKSNVYHLECFACQQCNHRFCVGDRFYLCDNKILCEYDYEERLVFANMAYNPSSLAHIRRQVGNLQPSGDDLMMRCAPASSPAAPLPPPTGMKGDPPMFCNEKSAWSSSSRAGLLQAPQTDEDQASSGYGSPDSQPEQPPQTSGETR